MYFWISCFFWNCTSDANMFVLVFVYQTGHGTADERSLCPWEEFKSFNRTPHSTREQGHGDAQITEQVGFLSATLACLGFGYGVALLNKSYTTNLHLTYSWFSKWCQMNGPIMMLHCNFIVHNNSCYHDDLTQASSRQGWFMELSMNWPRSTRESEIWSEVSVQVVIWRQGFRNDLGEYRVG